MTRYIHKAVRPKKDYDNPTACCAKLKRETAQRNSRITWDKVTCPHCLALKGKRRIFSHLRYLGWR